MKRALAERAKATPTASTTERTKQKLENSDCIPTSIVSSSSINNNGTLLCTSCLSKIPETTSATTKTRKKCKIESLCNNEENDNKFYLKHQNRALYSEYMSLKEDVSTLDKEKQIRKKDVNEALQILHEIEMLWKRIVFDLYGWLDCILNELAPDSCEQQNNLDSLTSASKPKFLTKETLDEDHEFENTTYLLQILHRFLQTMPSFQQNTKNNTKASFNESCHSLYQQMCHFSSLLSPIPSQQEENQAKISSLELSLEITQNQMKESTMNKDKALQQCRKIKKWFWRLVTERCTLQQARKVLEDQAYDLDNVALLEDDDNVVSETNKTNDTENKQIEELNLKISCRDEQIKEMTQQLQKIETKIADPTTPFISEEEHVKLTTELSTSQRIIKEQLTTLDNLTNQCAIEKANVLHYQKSLEDLQIKYDKKVQEVLLSLDNSEQDEANDITDINKLTELQHKYTQALEELKQLDSLRYTLKETRKLNDYHQHKMEEYKSKYISLTQNKKDNSKNNTKDNNEDPSNPSNDQSSNKVSYDKMKADFRRVRKELAAANLSKENYKSKLEKLDKERETLLKTNTRLLKQNSEKEEVNTKSLSTILHLKRILELKDKEKEQLENCKKSAEQLALSARMMIKGKERIGEELQVHKANMEEEQSALKQHNDSLQKQNDENITRIKSLQNTITNHQTQITTLQNQYQTAHEKLLQMQKEKFNLIEKISLSNNSSNKAAECSLSSTAVDSTSSQNNSNFSVDQLTTQISVLKGRLACPVCNYRDKACILARCRHMFCRHCIDENIKNRSRKCPACGQKFDIKDVGDIWL